jgi:tRNA dimethylallyltransferase
MIVGPTAAGKTELAHRLALELDGEIISVDSRQCYKRIDIGTAKPDELLLDEVSYFNISILDLRQKDTVALFLERSKKWKNQIQARGNTIIYAGGSTLHLQSLLQPLDDVPESNPENIAILENRIQEEGLQNVFSELQEVDPVYTSEMDGLNRQRIIRAMDVWMQTSKPFSSFHSNKEINLPDDILVYGLRLPRKQLHKKINERVDKMISSGLVEETENILSDGYEPDLQSLQTVGYRDVISYLKGEKNYGRMTADIKTQTRRYAKRQITWFRRWPFIRWFNADELDTKSMIDRIKQGLAADLNKG